MNLCQIVAVFSFGRSSTPPHQIDPCAGVVTHTRLTMAATPKPGTFRVKYGGNVEGVTPVILRRTPSWLTSKMVEDTPSIIDVRFGTSVRGDRRAGRPSASASATASRNASRVTGRSIHAASRGTSSIAASGLPTTRSGRFVPSTLMTRGSSVFGTSSTSAISASIGRDVRSRPMPSIDNIGTGSYPARPSHSRKAARSPGIGHATPILIGFEADIATTTVQGDCHGESADL